MSGKRVDLMFFIYFQKAFSLRKAKLVHFGILVLPFKNKMCACAKIKPSYFHINILSFDFNASECK